MLPSSDEVESYLEQLRGLHDRLVKYKGAEVKDRVLLGQLAAAAKEWFRMSAALRTVDSIAHGSLDAFDTAMRDVINLAARRTRASVYEKRFRTLVDGFVDEIVVPLIRFEGSPAQVAGRQLTAAFTAPLDADEWAYVDEAARCVSVRCYRAAIIMLWAAAIARFHQLAQNIGFATFNQALLDASAKKGDPWSRVVKGTTVATLPELQRLRDFDILVAGMQLNKYDLPVFEELQRLLGTRNSVAHPGGLHPSFLDVQQFAEKVNRLIFARIVI